MLDPPWVKHLLFVLLLGGLQGLMGWIMVKSGLADKSWVSPYKLTLHLVLALALFIYLIWLVLKLDGIFSKKDFSKVLRKTFNITVILVLIQIVFGGLMAGTHAAHFFNTFPTMNGQLIPQGMFSQSPFFINLFENIATIQFIHRWLAVAVFLAVIIFWLKARKASCEKLQLTAHILLGLTVLQFLLGVMTLLFSTPQKISLTMGVFHQGVAFILCGVGTYIYYLLKNAKVDEAR
jgi:cytochrome c oxidase assembly protein subunit 15